MDDMGEDTRTDEEKVATDSDGTAGDDGATSSPAGDDAGTDQAAA